MKKARCIANVRRGSGRKSEVLHKEGGFVQFRGQSHQSSRLRGKVQAGVTVSPLAEHENPYRAKGWCREFLALASKITITKLLDNVILPKIDIGKIYSTRPDQNFSKS